ncbi:hypothetical protein OOK13_44205 [Streptomyces sp. NBC_00378]|uniref:hypothetical protein n=1 Tax=unclassified Streptomyces TaxID=2593676 RepID=UPI0022570BE1|nr:MULTISPECIES: hypothetical protein [unclassified Streptomyces]MCX5115318.1 hypothetical protein [Streptomyces sp. NBC_00378]
MSKSPVRRTRVSGRSVLYAVIGLVTVALLAASVVAGNAVWNGAPYPTADPDVVAQRLKARSDEVYGGFGLPEKYAADSGRFDTGACYYRGLRGIAHIDRGRRDVRSFGLDWSVPGVPEAAARDAQRRVRRQLARKGWTLTLEGDRAGASFHELGFRFEDPEGGDQIDVRWNDLTTTLFISVYAPCGKVPDGFVGYDWGEADWHPKKQPTRT